MVRLSFLRDRRWTDQEQAWIDAESFPPVLVRSYTKEKHLKKGAKHLSSLGYGLSYQTWDWSGTGRWHATFKQFRR